jgi:hypothetical protein
MGWLGTQSCSSELPKNSYNTVSAKQSGENAMQQPSWFRAALLLGLLIAVIILAFGMIGHARAQNATQPDKPFVVEYYYKTKWGHADEFIALFKKNHYPLLKKQVEMGRFLKVSAVSPVYHTTEDGRWDYRVTIVYKNAAVANDGYDSGPLIKQLFPDQETYKKEEQRRFEILDGHWDLPIKDVDLDAK